MNSIMNIKGRKLLRYSSLLSAIFYFTFVSLPANASAWQECKGNKIRWNKGWTNMYLSTTSFPIGSVWDTRLQNAMWLWNNVKGSHFNFYVGRDTDGRHSRGNGVNEAYFSSTDAGSAIAVTFVRSHCYWAFGWKRGIDETDIAFNVNDSWSTAALDYRNTGSSPYNFEGVALHELGHALGLNHEDRAMTTMNSYYPSGGPLGYYKEWNPLGDDRSGARILYGDATTETDLAASTFKSTGDGTSGLVVSSSSAVRGNDVTIEFTFSNLSTARQTFDIGFYLSTNDYISTSDTLLGTNFGAWADAGVTGTYTRTLQIPAWVAPGTYHLGFIIDPNNTISEANKSNNSQPMPRTITILSSAPPSPRPPRPPER